MRHNFKVLVEDQHGNWDPILYTNDRWVAVRAADTREADVTSRVMNANGDVIHEHNADDVSLDVGQSMAWLRSS
jgi:hypothetical protein